MGKTPSPKLKGSAIHRVSDGAVRSTWRLSDGAFLMITKQLPAYPTYKDLLQAKHDNEAYLQDQARQCAERKEHGG